MKTKSWYRILAIFLALSGTCSLAPRGLYAQATSAPQGKVEAVQGDATMAVDQDQEPVILSSGSIVNAWNMVSTGEASKLFVRWNTGILNSLGELTSVFLASSQTERGPVDSLEMTEGMLRVTSQPGGQMPAPYRVTTPSASIEPVDYSEPTDFIVEVHETMTTVVTVISGNVKVQSSTRETPSQTVVSACQNVYVDQAQPSLDVATLTPDDLAKLVQGTTIPGSISTAFLCPPSPAPRLPSSTSPPFQPYDYEDWSSYEVYPYDEITVLPPRPGVGCVVILPGIGRWIIPVDVFVGWRFDPTLIRIYCRHVILDHIIYCDRYYLADVRLRRRQFRHMAYLAQLSGNTHLLFEAQRKLADLNVRSHWAAMRLNRLDRRVAALDKEQQKFGQRLPAGRNLFQAISHSFNSPRNLTVVRDFRHRVNTELNVQTQLANVTGKELVDLRARIARERDPRQRMALRQELTRINKEVAQGKVPIPKQQPQLKQLMKRLAKERNPKQVQNLQAQLGKMVKTEVPHTAVLLSPAKLTSLQQGLAKYPNRQKRQDLEKQVVKLQQSVEARVAAEHSWQKIDTISAQAAKEKNPRKRSELLGQLNALTKPVGRATGPAAALNALGQRQLLETQLSLEQDKHKRTTLQKTLEEQRKHHADLVPQELERRRKAEPAAHGPQELRKQTEPKVLNQGLPKHKVQTLPQQLEPEKLPQQQKEQLRHQKEQADRLRLQQQQTEQLRKQQGHTERLGHQEELRKQTEPKVLNQGLPKHKVQTLPQQLEPEKLPQQQKEQLRHQKEQADHLRLQQQQTEQLRKQQGHTERLGHQEELRKQTEPKVLNQGLPKHKVQTLPQQPERQKFEQQQNQQQSEQLRHQKEQADRLHLQQQQKEQLRKQQEHTERLRHQQDQAEKLRKQQQSEQLRHQKEQADRLHLQQQQKEQLRKQQEHTERLRHQQEQANQLRKQQQSEQLRHQKEQADRLRHQQQGDQLRKQQIHRQQQEEENKRKMLQKQQQGH